MLTARLAIGALGLALFAGVIGWGIAGSRDAYTQSTPQAETNTHRPVYAPASVYATGFAAVESHPGLGSIRGALVNHHLLATDFITDTLNTAANQSVRRVILISPNHFSAGRGWVESTVENWQTPNGQLSTDRTVVNTLANMNLVTIDETPWEHEHGVYNILPVIATYFPNATIVPVILKDGTPDELVDAASLALSRWFDATTLVVGSFDFSHYQTSTVADQHDIASLAAVENVDVNALPGLDADSLAGLRLLLQLMRTDAATKFSLFHHSNSAKIANHPDSTDTTSYITGVFTR